MTKIMINLLWNRIIFSEKNNWNTKLQNNKEKKYTFKLFVYYKNKQTKFLDIHWSWIHRDIYNMSTEDNWRISTDGNRAKQMLEVRECIVQSIVLATQGHGTDSQKIYTQRYMYTFNAF